MVIIATVTSIRYIVVVLRGLKWHFFLLLSYPIKDDFNKSLKYITGLNVMLPLTLVGVAHVFLFLCIEGVSQK